MTNQPNCSPDRERCREALLSALELLLPDEVAIRVRLTAACVFSEDFYKLGLFSRLEVAEAVEREG